MSEEIQEKDDSNGVKCPKCGSTSIAAQKEGYGAGKGCCGTILFGPLGLLCGAFGANKMNLHCLKCGHKWEAGKINRK